MNDLEIICEAARQVAKNTRGVVSFAFNKFAANIEQLDQDRKEEKQKQPQPLPKNYYSKPKPKDKP